VTVATNAEVFALHRYFIWADRMRVHFRDSLLREPPGTDDKQVARDAHAYPYMAYWYGGMHVVIEGWRELQLTDLEIDGLLDSPHVELLRRYRNGAFHFQRQYFDERFTGFWGEGDDGAKWIHRLRETFSRWFLDRLAQERKDRT